MGFSLVLRNNHLNLTMKTFISLACLSLVACAPGGGYHSRSRAAPPAPTKNIAELAIATPQLSTLLAAVKAAGLVDTLAGEGPFTVFATSSLVPLSRPEKCPRAQPPWIPPGVRRSMSPGAGTSPSRARPEKPA